MMDLLFLSDNVEQDREQDVCAWSKQQEEID